MNPVKRQVKILRGIPGCGKSTLTKQIRAEASCSKEMVSVRVFSADHFFLRDGVYIFNYKLLDDAHNQCLRGFVNAVVGGPGIDVDEDIIVVDNTHTTVLEMTPYVRVAKAFGVPFEVITIDCPVEIAAARGLHAVPANRVQAMFDRLKNNQVPKDWPHRVVPAGV
jgi:hypothetical protein